jgi:hypothetical protein
LWGTIFWWWVAFTHCAAVGVELVSVLTVDQALELGTPGAFTFVAAILILQKSMLAFHHALHLWTDFTLTDFTAKLVPLESVFAELLALSE